MSDVIRIRHYTEVWVGVRRLVVRTANRMAANMMSPVCSLRYVVPPTMTQKNLCMVPRVSLVGDSDVRDSQHGWIKKCYVVNLLHKVGCMCC